MNFHASVAIYTCSYFNRQMYHRHSVKNIVVSPSLQEETAKQETTKKEADTESVESDGKHN